MATPRYVAQSRADETYGLPRGVTEAWVRAGVVRTVWFVDRGQIVRGVEDKRMRHMASLARAAKIRRMRSLLPPVR